MRPDLATADAEAVIGYLLTPGAVPESEAIAPDLFPVTGHRFIVHAIRALRDAGTPPDPVAVIAALDREGHLEAAGGRAYIHRLTDGIPFGAVGWRAIRPSLEVLKEAAAERKIRALCSDIGLAAANGHTREQLAEMARTVAEQDFGADDAVIRPLDLTATPEPVPQIVRGVIPAGGKTLIVAPSNTGKGWIALDLALSVVTGDAWLGLEEHRVSNNAGGVVIVDEESPRHGLHSRLARLAAGRRLDLADLALLLTVYSSQGVNLGNPRAWEALDAVIRRQKPALVIMDPAGPMLCGSDCDPDVVAAYLARVDAIRRRGPAVLIVHNTGWGDEDRPRGRSEWRDRVDVELDLAKTRDQDTIRIAWGKARDWHPPAPFLVRREQSAEGVRLVYGGPAEGETLAGKDRDSALWDFVASGPMRTRTFAETKEHFVGADGKGERGFYRSVDRLKKDARLETTGTGYHAL
jgi:hypothetical protein